MSVEQQRRSISATIGLVEAWLENIKQHNTDDAARLARCVVILLTAHVDAHLTDRSKTDE